MPGLPSYDILNALLFGMIAMASLIACIVFWRYWLDSRDRFFLFFSLSFGTMALDRVALIFFTSQTEAHTMLYWVRLLAYLLILLAIVDKNYSGHRRSGDASDGG